MKKGMKTNMKSDVVTGLSSAVGATIGMIIGNAVSAEINAAEVPIPPISPIPEPSPVKPEPPKPSPVKPEPPKPETLVDVPPVTELEVEVLGYETLTNQDGSQMDVAVVRVDGQEIAIIDGDMDGLADVYVMDYNANGVLEDEEFIPIKNHNLAMAPLRDAVYVEENNLIAENDDYINDANIDDFMA